MTSALDMLLGALELETLGPDRFGAVTPGTGWRRIFGGQVVAQGLAAACRTVDGGTEGAGAARPLHALHAQFIRPGDPALPIEFEVERTRDGGSFSTRRILARQAGAAIFAMTASFHIVEPGLEHHEPMPDVPSPDALPSAAETTRRLLQSGVPETLRAWLERPHPIELRPVTPRDPRAPKVGPAQQSIWLRAAGPMPDDPVAHACVLAYASDFAMVDTALIPHATGIFDPVMMVASLDHTLWTHRPLRVDQWLLYHQCSPQAAGARGLTFGSVYARDGTMVASTAQEGLIRRRAR